MKKVTWGGAHIDIHVPSDRLPVRTMFMLSRPLMREPSDARQTCATEAKWRRPTSRYRIMVVLVWPAKSK